MPIRSESSSETTPLGRIKRIKDIVASRKNGLERHGKDIRQQALERSAFRTKKSNVSCINQKPTIAEIRESKKEAFAEEFSKMGCLKFNDKSTNKIDVEVDGRSGIRKGRLETNLEEGTKGHQSKHLAEQQPKPRWNTGTITSKTTEINHLYGYQEPFIKNFKQKHVCKDDNANEPQSKTKPSVKDNSSVSRKIPVIQSLIMEDKKNRADTIPKHASEPYMQSKRHVSSMKIHREKCHATDTLNSKPNDNTIPAATKYRKSEAASSTTEKQSDNVVAKDKKSPKGREKKMQMERPAEQERAVEVKEEEEHKTIKPKLFKSKIPAPSEAYTTVDSSLGLEHSRYFRCQCQCHCKSNVATVEMPESVEQERESSHPPCPRRVTEEKKGKVKSPSKKRPGTPRQKH